MEIILEYNTGHTFQITVPDDSINNAVACVLDDISTKVERRITCESN